MNRVSAHPVTLRGHGLSEQGHGVFVFEGRTGQQLPLAVEPDHLPTLMLAVADALRQAQERLGDEARPLFTPLPLESWTTVQHDEEGLLLLRVLGAEIRFRVTGDTIRTSRESDDGPDQA